MGNCAGIKGQQVVTIPDKDGDAKLQPGMQSWNDILMQRYNNDEFKKRGPPSKEDIYEMLSTRKLKSGLYLEVRVHTTVPIQGAYALTYDFKYSS